MYEDASSDYYIPKPSPYTQLWSQAKSIKQSRSYQQESYGQTDILLVVDNSGSMEDEQLNLSTRMSALLSRVKGSDWQIGIISTDYRDRCLLHLIRKGTPDVESRFSEAIRKLGIRGNNTERGFYMAYRGLSCHSSFPRPGSTLAVIFVSDEDNCGLARHYDYNIRDYVWVTGCQDRSHLNDAQLVNHVTAGLGRTLGKDISFHSLIYDRSSSCGGGGVFGQRYRALSEKSKGKVGDICADSYQPFFNQISIDIASKLDRVFSLNLGPKDKILDGTVQVRVNGVAQGASDFSIVAGKVRMASVPPPKSKIDIDFELESDKGLLEDLRLKHSPYLGQVRAHINGVRQPKSAYTLSGSTLRFVTDPPMNSVVRIDYEVAPVIPTIFLVEKGVTINQVLINGRPHSGYSYNSTTGQLSIAAAALRPDVTVRIVYRRLKK